MANAAPKHPGHSIARRLFVKRTAACVFALAAGPTLPAGAAPRRMMRGVALAGAEFGQLIPGQHGRDYIYPGVADFKYCAAQGFNVVRLPFKWDRLQPDLNTAFDPEEWARLAGAIDIARRLKLTIILDPHNYAHRRVRADDYTVDHLIGSPAVPSEAFSGFWHELAGRTKDQKHVVFGMMNEPADIAAPAWLDIANAALAAIRSAGATQLALVPGVAYTGAHSWHASGNTILEGLKDPGNNFAIEVHQYLDGDSSGKSGSVVSETIGAERIKAFEDWARTHKFKAFLGEFGGGPDKHSLKAMSNMLDAIEAGPDVWIGWTAWAAGPWWPDDAELRLSPSRAGAIPPQMHLLSKRARAKT